MAKVRFTAGRVRDFRCESSERPAFLWDATAPGLGLRATPNGSKAYIFQAKLRGNVIRLTIGDPAAWDIAAAQAEATRLRLMIDKGQDPRQVKADALAVEQAERRARLATELAAEAERIERQRQDELENRKRSLAARSAWEAYLVARRGKWGEQHYADHIIASREGGIPARVGDRQIKAGPLASLLDRPLYAITPLAVREWLVAECKERPTFAHNAYRKFRTFIQWCARHPEYQDIVHGECCLNEEVRDIVPANRTKEGDCLQREQLRAWFDSVRRVSNPVIAAYLQGLLITGARREELAQLRWADVDFQWRSLTIRDKVEGTRTIPLTPYLASLLSTLPHRNEWVFSSPTAGSGRLAEPRIAHTKALVIAGLPHVSLHGLRRSFGTLCEWVEVPSGVSAQIMGHKPSALAEKHYRRRPLDLLRMWHDKIETWLLEQGGVLPSDERTSISPLLRLATKVVLK
jgi:integrase